MAYQILNGRLPGTATRDASRPQQLSLPGPRTTAKRLARPGFVLRSSPWMSASPLLLGPYHGATVDLVGRPDRNLAAPRGIRDLGVRSQLAGCESAAERDLEFAPEWVEPVTLDRIEHRDKGLTTGQTRIRHEDLVDRRVVGDRGLLRLGRQLLEIDGEELPVIECGHVPGRSIRAAGPGGTPKQRNQSEREGDER